MLTNGNREIVGILKETPHEKRQLAIIDAHRMAWRADLMSLRLTCSELACRDDINAALFRDFNLYTSSESLARLRDLASSRHRHHLRRVALMEPQLRSQYESLAKY